MRQRDANQSGNGITAVFNQMPSQSCCVGVQLGACATQKQKKTRQQKQQNLIVSTPGLVHGTCLNVRWPKKIATMRHGMTKSWFGMCGHAHSAKTVGLNWSHDDKTSISISIQEHWHAQSTDVERARKKMERQATKQLQKRC